MAIVKQRVGEAIGLFSPIRHNLTIDVTQLAISLIAPLTVEAALLALDNPRPRSRPRSYRAAEATDELAVLGALEALLHAA